MLKKLFLHLKFDLILKLYNRTPRVLFWHGVDITPDPIIEGESIDLVNFVKQIDYLEKNFEIISIEEFYNRFTTKNFTNKEIVLTFDDGYLNNLTVLAPFLKKRDLPFTVFISTNHISSGILFPTSILRLIIYGSQLPEIKIDLLQTKFSIVSSADKSMTHSFLSKYIKEAPLEDVEIICKELINNLSENQWNKLQNKYNSVKLLNWSQVSTLQNFGGTIGSHCLDHICCHSNQSEVDLLQQITESKRVIESKLGVNCDFFAYPNGDYTILSNEIVNKAGYKMGFSTKRERIDSSSSNINALPRLGLPFNMDTFKFFINLYPKK